MMPDDQDALRQGSALQGGATRITSYNVCYTKLLRVLTAVAIDGHGLAGSDAISLAVLVDVPPTVDITSPLDGAEVLSGTPVELIATATDPVDGDVGASLRRNNFV